MPSIARNNFDLIRLLAALQVAVLHVTHELSGQFSGSLALLTLEVFPGVPIFFFISGFLISRSYEKAGSIAEYTRNRSLRIFPALHVCVLLNLIVVALTGYFARSGVGLFDIVKLYLAKTTFLQFYNPDFMRPFGDGVLNGSLWTICVELQFYVLTPVLYRLFMRGTKGNVALVVLILISIAFNRLLYGVQSEYAQTVLWKLGRVSFLPWVYMFLTGVWMQRNFETVKRALSGRLLAIAFPAYAILALWLRHHGFYMDNSFSPLLFFPLAAVVLLAAYTAPELARKLLRGQDISYGLYIYHVPVMNMFLYYGLTGNFGYTGATLGITLVLAVASWLLIERPSLSRKRKSIHPVAEHPAAEAAKPAIGP